jgi:hypothetical protein
MTHPPKLTRQQLRDYFPAVRPRLKERTFELGLVLAGTVSAGAYTAGVLDYLLEALDAWQRAKEDGDPLAPRHDVVISTMAGSSGGGINGAVLLRAAGWQFPHGPSHGNPLYSYWMGGSDFQKLLTPGPADGIPGLSSVLNCASVDVHASRTIEFTGEPLGTGDSPRHREFLADPLRLFVTVGNLTGLPYTIQLAGESALSHVLCAHGDYMRFALGVDKGVPNKPATRPDELALRSTSPPDVNWTYLRDAGLATSAFPVAFLPRRLVRPLAASGFRVAAVPQEDGRREVTQLVPNWDVLSAGEPDPRQSTFLNVDGGILNNEPLELVRTALAGFNARNARKASKADRAVILIDPFSDAEKLPRPEQGNLAAVIGATITSLMHQARFKAEDVALANAENVYSRFLIAPVGPGPDNRRTVGERAIASGALGGFAGLVDASFLAYDFSLGRFNTHKFLAEHLALPVTLPPEAADPAEPNNPIFDRWTPEQINTYVFRNRQDPNDTTTYLPIIPLMAGLRANPPKLLRWPELAETPEYLEAAIQTRLQSVYELAKSEIRIEPGLVRTLLNAYLWIGWRFFLRGALRDAALKAVTDGLVGHGLIPKPAPIPGGS